MSEKTTPSLDDLLETIGQIKSAYVPPAALNPPAPQGPPPGAVPAGPPAGAPPPAGGPPPGAMPPMPPAGAPAGPDPAVQEILNAMGQLGQVMDQMVEENKKLQERIAQQDEHIKGYEARQAEVDGKLELMLKILGNPPMPAAQAAPAPGMPVM